MSNLCLDHPDWPCSSVAYLSKAVRAACPLLPVKRSPHSIFLCKAQSVSVHFSPHKTSNEAARFVSQAYALGDKVWR
jgi:hypothetical protein